MAKTSKKEQFVNHLQELSNFCFDMAEKKCLSQNDITIIMVKMGEEFGNMAEILADEEGTELENQIAKILRDFAISANFKGYGCLKTAIILAVQDPKIMYQITKRLYPEVAKIQGTTPSRAERAIRHAIESSWNKMEGMEMKEKYFRNVVSANKGKPTNSEFIATVAESIRMNM